MPPEADGEVSLGCVPQKILHFGLHPVGMLKGRCSAKEQLHQPQQLQISRDEPQGIGSPMRSV